jgi:hypothetical protein
MEVSMMPTIVMNTATMKVRKVKDLGWLLRHRKDGITDVAVTPLRYGRADLEVAMGSILFGTTFESLEVCLDWVDRFIIHNGWASTDNIDANTLHLIRQYKWGVQSPLAYFDAREP